MCFHINIFREAVRKQKLYLYTSTPQVKVNALFQYLHRMQAKHPFLVIFVGRGSNSLPCAEGVHLKQGQINFMYPLIPFSS